MPIEIPVFKRSMKVIGSLLITLSAITPASTIFIIVPDMVRQAGTGAFLSFLIAAVVCVFMAFVYAELSSAYPLTGGEYAIVGRVLGPFYGFAVLGIGFIVYPLSFAALAQGVAEYVQPFIPGLSVLEVAVGTVIVTALFGVLNIRVNAVITGVFFALEMLVILVLCYLGFGHISHSLSEFILTPVYLGDDQQLHSATLALIGPATAVAIWAYAGYGSAVYLGEETHDAPKNVARVIFLALIIAIISIALPVTAVLMGSPDLKTLFAAKSLLPDFIARHGSDALGKAVGIGVVLAIFNALIAIGLMCARLLYSSGRDHVWPAVVNRALTRLHGKFNSPWVATLVFGALGTASCFIDQKLLFVMIGTGLVVVYLALSCAAIVGRLNGTTRHAAYKMPWFPLPPLAGIAALLYVVYADYLDEKVGRLSLMATGAMVVVATLYYVLILRRRGDWKLQGPVA